MNYELRQALSDLITADDAVKALGKRDRIPPREYDKTIAKQSEAYEAVVAAARKALTYDATIFHLGDEDSRRFKEWNERHVREQHAGDEPYCGAIGGRISFTVTSTSLGQIVGAQCNSCSRKDLDRDLYTVALTDFSDW